MPFLPTNDPTPDSLQRQIAELRAELRKLMAKPEAEDTPRNVVQEVVFSRFGVIPANDPSGHYLVKHFDAMIHRVDFTCRVPGSVDTVWAVRVNDVVVYSFTITAGDDAVVDESLAIPVEEFDKISVDCTTADVALATVVINLTMVAVEGSHYH
jgi:hypothetical protein